jgi:proline dehydrogenase
MSHLHAVPTRSLLRSLLVFRCCTLPPLVRHAHFLLSLSARVIGRSATDALVKRTFFSQFCGGESLSELAPLVASLRARGVGSILDYAAETDEGGADGAAADDERDLDAAQAASDVAVRAAGGGFAAVKLSSLARPELLKRVTSAMHAHRRSFRVLVLAASGGLGAGLSGLYTDSFLSREAFVTSVGPRAAAAGIDAARLFALVDVRRTGRLSYLDFCDAARMLGLGSAAVRTAAAAAAGAPATDAGADAVLSVLVPPEMAHDDGGDSGGAGGSGTDTAAGALAGGDRAAWARAHARLAALARTAQESDAALLCDAEQTYLQAAIDLLVITAQRRFHVAPCTELADGSLTQLPEEVHAAQLANAGGGAAAPPAPELAPAAAVLPPHLVIFNTYQAYLRDSTSRLELALERARHERWVLGVKLVRGAYMVQERARANALGYSDPIHGSVAATHVAYDAAASRLVELAAARRVTVMIATHNEASVSAAAAAVSSNEPPHALEPGGVSFGQLLGMSDHLTFTLAERRLPVFKYVPFGRVGEVLPYLLRRAEENADVLGGVGKEIQLLQEELWRRLTRAK